MKLAEKSGAFGLSIFTLVIFLALFGWRPFYLGFYSDDYILFVDPLTSGTPASEVARNLLGIYINRPIAGLWAAFFVGLCRENPILWHSVLISQAFLAALLIASLIKRLINLMGVSAKETPALVFWFWPLLPITYGFLAWPTYSHGNFCLHFFLISFLFLLSDSRHRVVFVILFYALSVLTLEHFYLQMIPLLILALWQRKKLDYSTKDLGIMAFGLVLIQGSAALFNRLIQGGIRKGIDFDFIASRISGVIANPTLWYQVIIPIFALLIGILILQRLWHFWKSKKTLPGPLVLISVATLGLLLSAFVCLAAGYSIRPFGIGSRTTMATSVWLVVLVLGAALQIQSIVWRRIFLAGLLAVCLVLNIWQGIQWAGSWREQQRVVSNAPVDLFKNLPPGSTVIGVVPNYYGEVIVFDEDWTLGPALLSRHPELRDSRLAFIPHKNASFSMADLRFEDGQIVRSSRYSGHKLGSRNVGELFLWNSYTGGVYQVIPPWTLPAGSNPLQIPLENLKKI